MDEKIVQVRGGWHAATVNLEDRLLKLFQRPKYTPQDPQQLASALSLPADEAKSIREVLRRMERQGRVARIRHDRYTLPTDADLIPGRIMMQRSGAGRLQPDDARQSSVEVPAEATGTAFHLDRVLVRRDPVKTGARGPAVQARGKVIRVLERARADVAGTLQRSKQFFYVVPDDPRIPHDIYVPSPTKKEPADIGDKVVVEILEWPSRHTNPEGRIREVLGKPDQPGVDMEAILRQYGLPTAFPAAVEQAGGQFGNRVRPEDMKGRRDCRGQATITIDPDDAKDFDDAISLERSDGNHWRLRVHIADVSHYVKPGDVLDEEARRRGNSTYLVDRVIPMLPEALSNELCSLKPEVERLTKCVEFLLTDAGRVVKAEFYPSVIRSRRRFTYQEALGVLKGKGGDAIDRMVRDAGRLAQRIRAARMKAGSLNMDFPEHKLRLDERGRFSHVEVMENDESHQLIEEFMLLANEAVAGRLRQQNRPAVFRIHEDPDPERLEELRQEMRAMGVPAGNLAKKGELQKLIARLKEHPASDALMISVLRSLKRARYAAEPLGHFGLGKRDYTHFTSPIRRYADLLVHRALFESRRPAREELVEVADRLSFTERNSADAEQDSKTVKIMAHLEGQLTSEQRETYEGVITNVLNFGFMLEVAALGIGGMVRVSSLEDDFYVYEESRNRLRGRRRRRTFEIGNPVTVQVTSVDRFKKQVNFRLAERGRKR